MDLLSEEMLMTVQWIGKVADAAMAVTDNKCYREHNFCVAVKYRTCGGNHKITFSPQNLFGQIMAICLNDFGILGQNSWSSWGDVGKS
jgi:hypothetical protein